MQVLLSFGQCRVKSDKRRALVATLSEAGSHSQRTSDCGLFAHVHPQFEAPVPRRKFTLLQRRARGQESADRGYQLIGNGQ